MNDTVKTILGLIIVVGLYSFFSSGPKEKQNTSTNNTSVNNNIANVDNNSDPVGKFSNGLLTPYKRGVDKQVFAVYGDRAPLVEKARLSGALLAAKSEDCVTVKNSELSGKAKNKNNIIIFVDCSDPQGNNKRFLFEEKT